MWILWLIVLTPIVAFVMWQAGVIIGYFMLEKDDIHFHHVFPDKYFTHFYWVELRRMNLEQLKATKKYIREFVALERQNDRYRSTSMRLNSLEERIDEYTYDLTQLENGMLTKAEQAREAKQKEQGRRDDLYADYKYSVGEIGPVERHDMARDRESMRDALKNK